MSSYMNLMNIVKEDKAQEEELRLEYEMAYERIQREQEEEEMRLVFEMTCERLQRAQEASELVLPDEECKQAEEEYQQACEFWCNNKDSPEAWKGTTDARTRMFNAQNVFVNVLSEAKHEYWQAQQEYDQAMIAYAPQLEKYKQTMYTEVPQNLT